ncbi:TolC family protein [Gracilimonas amylolytica]|uniref:TolC family protein n=1 Tax=Gracilimonas amylolytica TaxID=1749045 RepID=UPI000CD9DBD3|nr:TolC family protein [Gracilimonas amylolytica]
MSSNEVAVGNLLFTACIYVLCLGFAGNTAYAQDGHDLDRLSARLDSVAMVFLNNLPETGPFNSKNVSSVFFDSSLVYSDLTQAEIDLLKYRQEVLHSDLGVELTSGLLQNLDQGVFGQEGIFYQRRAQVGVQWNVLKDGLFENKSTGDQLSSEIRIMEKKAQAISHQEALESKIDRFRSGFNKYRLELLRDYLKILEEQKYALTRLYEQNYITLDRVLEVTSRMVRTESAIDHNEKVSRFLGEFDTTGLSVSDYPVFNIDLERLRSEGLIFYDELTSLQQSVDYKFYNELSLSTYLRYNLYAGTNPQSTFQNNGSREFFSVGLNLSLPIPLSLKGKKNVHDQEQKIRKLNLQSEKNEISDRLFERYQAYQEALQNYITLSQNVLLHQDKIRVQNVRRSIGSDMYSPSELLTAVSNLYQLSLQILDVKEDLYLRLFEMQALIPDHSLSTYLTPFEVQEPVIQNTPEYGLYVWSESLTNYSTESLINDLKNEGINTVFISAGAEKEELNDVQTLIETASKDLRVELMIGDPNLIFEDRFEKLQEHIEVADSIGAAGVHLDVEPHTLDGWEENNEEYLEAYMNMVDQVRSWTNDKGLTLTLSITEHYESIFSELDRRSDQLVLMTYGQSQFEGYSQRFGSLIMEAPLGTAVALRTSDFQSMTEMKSLMQSINDGYGGVEFFIQDFGGWQQLKNK